MTYPNIAPKLRLEETISSPFDPAKILGFTGRNKTLGNSAVIMKETALVDDDNGPTVQIPKRNPLIDDGRWELIVLLENRVLAMTGIDFYAEYRLLTAYRGGESAEMVDVSLNNEKFREFSRTEVEIGN